MRLMKLASAVLFAVMAFCVMAASSASAFHPLFLTESLLELLFSGEGGSTYLRALNLGIIDTIECEKILVHGWALNKSTLAHRIKILLHTKCQELYSGTTTPCAEPIHVKELLGELGLLLLTTGSKIAAILLRPSDGTNVFASVTCSPFTSTFEGPVIGEIPEKNKKAILQYNEPLAEFEVVFRAQDQGLNQENQELRKINLLNMEQGGELEASGTFSGKTSLETSFVVKGDGKIEICTLAPAGCPPVEWQK